MPRTGCGVRRSLKACPVEGNMFPQEKLCMPFSWKWNFLSSRLILKTMHTPCFRFTISCLCLSLGASLASGCASSPIRNPAQTSPSPVAATAEPDDQVLNRSIKSYLTRLHAPAWSRYEYTRVDLNRDGQRDALILLKAPYGHWCDDNGCTLLILSAQNGSFTPVGTVHPVRPPLYVSPSTTNSWHDLILRVSGREEDKARNVTLRFDGGRYPSSPDSLPASFQLSKNRNTTIFP